MVHQPRPTNITRTWTAEVVDRLDNAVVQVRTHTVTLAADHIGHQTAVVDGEPSTVQRAVQILEDARLVVMTSEVRQGRAA